MVYSEIEKGKRICFLGLGLSNLSLLHCLPLSKCEVSIRSEGKIDFSLIPQGISNISFFEGEDAFKNIYEDILIFSPSVRRERKEFDDARGRGAIFTSDAELFFEIADKPVFGITGSDGKSTTSTMVSLLMSEAGYRVGLIGNIGIPMTAAIDGNRDFYVAELSSFMLQYANPSVLCAGLTNITENHLNWHKDFEEYKKTKIRFVKSSEKFVISDDDLYIDGAFGIVSFDRFCDIKSGYPADLYITREDEFICRNGKRILHFDDIRLKEKHNIQNLMMAIAMTDGYVGDEEIYNVAKSFSGLKHRCQTVYSAGGVDYIDSSIDSTPSRTVKTLSSLDRRVVLILGGRGKGLNYSELCDAIQKYAPTVVISGENANEIYSAIKGQSTIEVLPSFESAVRRGIELAEGVGALLLSPASTSYDSFKSYAERGDRFRDIIFTYYKST